MAETEFVTLINVETGKAVESVRDLKDNISRLKSDLEQTNIGSKDYQRTLKELQVNQAALRDAMHGTSASFQDIERNANGVGKTYNALVAQMAQLKQRLRNVDVSTEDGAKQFANYAEQINAINNQLKEMDAQQGNFQRNVGSYEQALSKFGGLGKTFDNLKTGMEGAGLASLGLHQSVDNLGKSFKTLSVNPVIGVISLVLPVIIRIVEEIKKSTAATDALSDAAKAFEPILSYITTAIAKVGEMLGKLVAAVIPKVIAGFGKLAEGIGKIISKVPFLKGVGDALQETGQKMQAPIDREKELADNADSAATATEKATEKVKSYKDALTDALKVLQDFSDSLAEMQEEELKVAETGEALRKVALDNLTKAASHAKTINDTIEQSDADRAANVYAIESAANERRLQLLQDFASEAMSEGRLEEADAYTREYWNLQTKIEEDALKEQKRLRDQDKKDAEQAAKEKTASLKGYASATTALLDGIADIYEQDGENNKKSAKKAKAIRIASATLSTLQGAVDAYTSAMASLPAPANIVVGAANAAAVTAVGVANIAKMRATNVESTGGGTIAAPSVPASISAVHNTTTASDEIREINKASSQRVYILQSDLEANENARKANIEETTW